MRWPHIIRHISSFILHPLCFSYHENIRQNNQFNSKESGNPNPKQVCSYKGLNGGLFDYELLVLMKHEKILTLAGSAGLPTISVSCRWVILAAAKTFPVGTLSGGTIVFTHFWKLIWIFFL